MVDFWLADKLYVRLLAYWLYVKLTDCLARWVASHWVLWQAGWFACWLYGLVVYWCVFTEWPASNLAG